MAECGEITPYDRPNIVQANKRRAIIHPKIGFLKYEKNELKNRSEVDPASEINMSNVVII
jgi:hypothetical protein